MFKLIVLIIFLANASQTVHGGLDIAGIISGLNQKATEVLKNVALPVFNNQVNFIKDHFDGLLAFFRGKEGDIAVPNTPFKIHFVADRCTLLGKRLLIVDLQKCQATATESKTGLTTTCNKGSQKEAIQCATEEVLNLVKLVAIALKDKGGNFNNNHDNTIIINTHN